MVTGRVLRRQHITYLTILIGVEDADGLKTIIQSDDEEEEEKKEDEEEEEEEEKAW